MNFKEITKNSNLIKDNYRNSCTITLTEAGFYFSNKAAVEFDMLDNKYFKLLINENESGENTRFWYFIVSSDSTGFTLTVDKRKKNPGVRMSNRSLVAIFKKNCKAKIGDKFYLQKTEHEFQKKPVIEIITNKSVNTLLK